ncbi:hypothetical protein EJ110_NYTH53697 [Nymphaea thermarum]|nr:hypothetical protein EJ110_NYTH53697 [Nymphaea thermarum]
MDRAVGEIDHGRNRVTDLKRKRAVKCAAFLMSERCGKIKRAGSRRGLRFPLAEGFSHGCGCCSGKSMINNYGNFRKSGLPKRIMFFSKGEWCDFPADLREPLVVAFRSNRSTVEVALDAQTCLVDFLHMLLIDLSSGLQQSVAWIDEDGEIFYRNQPVEIKEVVGENGDLLREGGSLG